MNSTFTNQTNINSLADIRDVNIDLALSVEEKRQSYIQQIINPNFYRYGDTVIRISYSNSGVKMKDLIVQYLVSKQVMAL